jgi:AcrR family transcriptional regulator
MDSSAESRDERRKALVVSAADHLLLHGFAASGLRALARAAGTSDRMLLYYFRDKEELLEAALAHIAGQLTLELAAAADGKLPVDALSRRIARRLLDDRLWPYMRLWLEMASRAAHGDPLCRRLGEALGRGFLAWGEAQLESADDAARAGEAARLFAMIEGLVLLKSLGLDDVVAAAIGP